MNTPRRYFRIGLFSALIAAAGTFAQACDKPAKPGLLALDVDQYTALGYLPESAAGKTVPLVINLHPTGGTGLRSLNASRHVADENGFIMLAPTGAVGPVFAGWTWNVPGVPTFGSGNYPPEDARDDVAFISKSIDAMEAVACVDPSRIYVIGFSGGARMGSRLACDLSDRIAAVVPIGGIRFSKASDAEFGLPSAKECAPSRNVPIKTIHGHWDPINVWYEEALGETSFMNVRTKENWVASAPKQGTSWSYSGETALARWVEFNGCSTTPIVTSIADGVERRDYPECKSGGEVGVVFFKDMGHAIPGHPVNFLPGQAGTTKIDGYALAWELLKEHRLSQ